MTTEAITVVGGVDTHKHTHYAAALDQHGRPLGHQEFPATDRGYQTLLAWMRGHGQIRAIGVESTGSFGATLIRALTKAGERVVEVNRPNRLARHGRQVRPPRCRADRSRGPRSDLDRDPQGQVRLSGYDLMCRSGYDLTCRSRQGDHVMGSPPATRVRRSLRR